MGKTVIIVALTWSLMRASDTWLNDGRFAEAMLFIALTALIWASAAQDHQP